MSEGNNEYARVFLSRRNLLTLLAKLDGVKAGRPSSCTIIKQDMVHPTMPQTHRRMEIIAVEDEAYYIDRGPGVMREDSLAEAAIALQSVYNFPTNPVIPHAS